MVLPYQIPPPNFNPLQKFIFPHKCVDRTYAILLGANVKVYWEGISWLEPTATSKLFVPPPHSHIKETSIVKRYGANIPLVHWGEHWIDVNINHSLLYSCAAALWAYGLRSPWRRRQPSTVHPSDRREWASDSVLCGLQWNHLNSNRYGWIEACMYAEWYNYIALSIGIMDYWLVCCIAGSGPVSVVNWRSTK